MSRDRLYRAADGKFLGVCAGLARWLRIDVGLVRLAFIIGSFMTGGVVFFIYLALGIFLPVDESYDSESIFDKMRDEFSSERDRRRDRSRGNRRYNSRVTVEDVKDEFDNLKSRVSKMEDTVFNKERDWDTRFKNS